ncbi:MAG: hypothetical protein KGH75_13650, partial [Rhodospirillales bacterium]|nr:hypothetical protein [Rhodospirillales bacterium]
HVQKLAGHSSVQVTEKYAHHAPNQGVSEVAKLEQWHNSGTPAQLTEKKASKIKRPRSSVG